MSPNFIFQGYDLGNALEDTMKDIYLGEALEGTTLEIHPGVTLDGINQVEKFSTLAVLENRRYINEIDEVRVAETAEIMADVFSEDVLNCWSDMTLNEKTLKLNEYYIRAGENLGINTRGVIIENMSCDEPGMTLFGYNSGDGFIHLNASVVNDPTQLRQVLDTATHEMRHQFQNDVIASPEKYTGLPQHILARWAYELNPNNYISPDYDYEGYYGQAIECDARDFSENVLISYSEKM